MTDPRRARCMLAAVCAVLLLPSAPVGRTQQADAKKPSLSLRATPPTGFTPLRVRGVADIRDGSDDFADFYCASAEWEWGDDTTSENSSDCEPYEAGKSTIQRRFTAEHIYRQPGQYRVIFKLKQEKRQVASVGTNIIVRASAGDSFGR